MRRLLFLAPLALVWGLAGAAPDAAAYSQYSQNQDATNCRGCHGDFRASPYVSFKDGTNWGTSLHDGHRQTMLAGDCDTCHTTGGRFPVILNSSNGGTDFDPIACVGCHGRDEGGNVTAAGLRQHHWNAGVTVCSNCHGDANPAGFTPVAENVSPPYYFTPDSAHPNKPTDPCDGDGSESVFGLTGLDNDGDLLDDGADSDCAGNQAPTADANGPYTGTAGVAVTFDGSASSDPDGTIVSYAWAFGDGGTGSGVSPTHVYAASGTYNVTLTVTDDGGLPGTDTTTATIVAAPGNIAPTADANGPYTGTVGVAVQFDGSGSSDPDGSIVVYDWDFGDGTIVLDAGPAPTHTYAAADLYGVTLTVTDDLGAIDSDSTTADIAAPGVLDLDIAQLSVTKRVSLGRVKPVGIKLVVKNNGTVEGSALATITGEQNGLVVYSESLTVTDAVGNGRTRYDDGSSPSIPPFTPTVSGDILWTATIADDDPDNDEATAVTRVVE